MKRLNYKAENYPLQWLDLVCQESLNPAKMRVAEFGPQQAESLLTRFNREITDLQLRIKAHIIGLSSPKKIKAVVWQYHTAVQLLKEQARNNINSYPRSNKSLKSVGQNLVLVIDDLLTFLERRYALFLPRHTPGDKPPPAELSSTKRVSYKVLCSMSADQIGLVLKAADDLKIIMARSLSIVFKTIIPFLSTKNTAKLSWTSVRSHTYVVEESDKEFVIRMLEDLIEKIRTY